MNVIKKKRTVFLATLALLTVNLSVLAWFMSRGFGMTGATWCVLALASVVTLLLHLTNLYSGLVSSATLGGFYMWLLTPLMYGINAVLGGHPRTASPELLIYSLSASVMITFAFTVMAALYALRCR